MSILEATINQNTLEALGMPDFISVAEAARRLSVTSRSVTRWVLDGKFPGAFKLNSEVPNSPYLIPEKAFLEFEAERISQAVNSKETSN